VKIIYIIMRALLLKKTHKREFSKHYIPETHALQGNKSLYAVKNKKIIKIPLFYGGFFV